MSCNPVIDDKNLDCSKDPYLLSLLKEDNSEGCDFERPVSFSSRIKKADNERCPIDKRCSCIFQILADRGLGKTTVNPYAVCSAVKFLEPDKKQRLAPGPIACRWTRQVLNTYTKNQLFGWIVETGKKNSMIYDLVDQVYQNRKAKSPRDVVYYFLKETLKLLTKPELVQVILLFEWCRKPKIKIPLRCVRSR